MPTRGDLYGYGPNESKRMATWEQHYMSKGCSNTKAEIVARRKVRQSRTWPPGTKT